MSNSIDITAADQSVSLGKAQRIDGGDGYLMKFHVYGNGGNAFGGGTVAIQGRSNPDAPKTTYKKADGTDLAFTADGHGSVVLPFPRILGREEEVFATISGTSSTPAVRIDVS